MKKFKIVVAGCGGMAETWVKYALSRDDSEIVGLVDIKRENAEAMANKYQLNCPVFVNLSEGICNTGANMVFDVTIPSAHKETVITALELGCDVLGEKPMASCIEEAKEMVAAAQRTGKNYAVMQNRRYLKNIRALKKLLASNTIGQPGFVCADFFLGPHFGGFRDVMDSPLILDMAIHTFDQARFITGADPVSVYCHEFNPPGSWYKGNASAICIFEFTNNIVFCYRGSWCAEGAQTSWEAQWRITGSNGTAIWDGINCPFAEVAAPSEQKKFINDFKRVEAPNILDGKEGHDGCLDEMFDAILNGRKAETDCTDNIKSIAMVFGALESSRTGKKVDLSY